MTAIIAIALAAAGPVTCVGNGTVPHAGEPKTESRSGVGWLDDFNNRNDAFTAEISVDDGEVFRMTMPRQLMDFPAYVPMVKLSDDGRNVKTARSMGPRRYVVSYDRQSGSISVDAPEGSFSGICRKT